MGVEKLLEPFKEVLSGKSSPNPFVNLKTRSRSRLKDFEGIRRNSLKNKFKTLARDGKREVKKRGGNTVPGEKGSSKGRGGENGVEEDLFDLEELDELEEEEEDIDIDDLDEPEEELFDDLEGGEDEMGEVEEEFDLDDDLEEGLEEEVEGWSEPEERKKGGSGDNSAILDRLDELEHKLGKLDVSVSMLKKENDEMMDKIKKLDETTIQFLSLYEVVSEQVNPFVGDSGMNSAVTERFDQIEARLSSVEEIVAVVKSIEARLDVIQGNDTAAIETVTEMVNNLSHRIEDLEERIEKDKNEEEIDLKFNNIFQRLTELGMQEEEIKKEIESFKEVISELQNLQSQNAMPPQKMREDKVETPPPSVKDGECRFEGAVDRIENDPVRSLVLIRWVEFLLERVGRNNLLEALNYYVHIGWISKELRNQAMEYAAGMDYYKDKAEWRLSPEDHKKSLLFIEMIRGREIDMITVNLVEQEVMKLKNMMGGEYGI
ncbi:MAG TPA: hypothetical protein ENI32_05205 [Candidatus Syntrophoarchaeum butanivorans]|uniref:Flagella protein n=2 Tax=Candidatus Syntropharchaeum butanivorans TaxID=1839936 RepID=A0A1F2P5V4_9EURY|nr:MAG: flagella protein [Candidatus Syntrophoarchaeum butanivorans]HEC57263.1 hypothetical protein [Candidatus Syntrophoarchaeum butanivorans]